MKFRRRPSPLLLLLLPAIASAAAVEKSGDKALSQNRAVPVQDPLPLTSIPASPKKDDIGTVHAPVDGQDGMPHRGPFVGDSTDKAAPKVEDLVSESPAKATVGPSKIVEEDGVMNDRNRPKPQKGFTGTEGGVSEKEKERKEHAEKTGKEKQKIPDPPKNAPPLPHSEQEHISGKDSDKTGAEDGEAAIPTSTQKALGAVGLEKPTDLPDTPHEIPLPTPAGATKDHLDTTTPTKGTSSSSSTDDTTEPGEVIQPFHAFVLSLTMILFAEIGDKTFLVAALMAMRHPRLLVFSAAFSALFVMTVLSAVLGHAVPTLLPIRLTHIAAAVLFFIFGLKLMREGWAMSPDEGVGEEMREVEQELEEKESLARRNNRHRNSDAVSPFVLESGRNRRPRSSQRLPAPARSPSSSPSRSLSPRRTSLSGALSGLENLLSLLLSPAWVQTFVMTFLGEWGDRSQIATVAMAAGQDYWWITGGALLGHSICTGIAAVGGRALAGRVSMRVVTLGGAAAFLIFGVIYLFEGWYSA